MEAYMKLVGENYLQDTLAEVIGGIVDHLSGHVGQTTGSFACSSRVCLAMHPQFHTLLPCVSFFFFSLSSFTYDVIPIPSE